jgi:uncharacterized protein (DUF1501 family)
MISRRELLNRSVGFFSLGPLAPTLWRRAAEAAEPRRDNTILVVLELTGGNDGLNTVVPFADDVYHKSRPTLRVQPEKVLKLDDHVGLHPALKELHKRWESGHLAVVQGVGYPNPNRSHFRSMEIWQTGTVGPATPAGWLGRVSDAHPRWETCHVGQGTSPLALVGRKSAAQSISSVDEFRLDPGAELPTQFANHRGDSVCDQICHRYASARALVHRLDRLRTEIPSASVADNLDGRMETICRLIEADSAYRVYYTSLGGFDTHAGQLYAHQELLRMLGQAVAGFLEHLKSRKLDDRVLVLVFSEFGRRLKENASGGTDHGSAAPVLLAGPSVKAGLIGPHPSLANLDETGDPRFSVDFRDVYATVLRRWLYVDPLPILGARNSDLALL